MNYSQIFIENLVYLIKKNNINIGEFEKSVNVSKGYFSRESKCKRSISFDTVVECSKLIGIKIEDIITYNKDSDRYNEIDETIERLQKEKEELKQKNGWI